MAGGVLGSTPAESERDGKNAFLLFFILRGLSGL